MSSDPDKRKGNVAFAFKASLIFVILAITFTLLYRYLSPSVSADNPKLARFEKSLQDIRAAMNVDSVRQYQIQKMMRIISDYNQRMPSGVSYEIAEEIYRMSMTYTNLDVDLICAVITHESGNTWEPEVLSETGAMGLMQIMPTTATWIAHYEGITWTSPEEILYNPIYNIRIGCRQLSSFVARYELEGGLAAYSGGERRAAVWLSKDKADGILWTETSNYIPHILQLYSQFKALNL